MAGLDAPDRFSAVPTASNDYVFRGRGRPTAERIRERVGATGLRARALRREGRSGEVSRSALLRLLCQPDRPPISRCEESTIDFSHATFQSKSATVAGSSDRPGALSDGRFD